MRASIRVLYLGDRMIEYPRALNADLPVDPELSLEEAWAGLVAATRAAAEPRIPSLRAGLKAAEIAGLEDEYAVRLPTQIRKLYRLADGEDFDDVCSFPDGRFYPLREALANQASLRSDAVAAGAGAFLEDFPDPTADLIPLFHFDGEGVSWDPERGNRPGYVVMGSSENDECRVFRSLVGYLVYAAKICSENLNVVLEARPGVSDMEYEAACSRQEALLEEHSRRIPLHADESDDDDYWIGRNEREMRRNRERPALAEKSAQLLPKASGQAKDGLMLEGTCPRCGRADELRVCHGTLVLCYPCYFEW